MKGNEIFLNYHQETLILHKISRDKLGHDNEMSGALYHIIVIVVAVLAIVKGFRRGFTGQVSGILGFAFGAVCAHIFGCDAADIYRELFPGIRVRPGSGFIYSVLGAVTVYVIVFYTFKMLTAVLRRAMDIFEIGMLDSLFGAAFSLLKYLLVLSVVYNLILCVNPSSPLMKYSNADDGNIVEGVMLLAPACLGCGNVNDLYHLLQLREAKKISLNYNEEPVVIIRGQGEPIGIIKKENAQS